MQEIDFITGSIIDSAMRIHTALGPGLFESVYEVVLERDLLRRGLHVERQKALGFEFEGLRFENAFVLDLLVDGLVVVEIKSVEKLAPVHEKQLQTYLRLADCRAGLLINFNEALLKHGLKRMVNRLNEISPRPPLPRVPRVK
jgi:iron complex transport system substrate-binding protein